MNRKGVKPDLEWNETPLNSFLSPVVDPPQLVVETTPIRSNQQNVTPKQ
jgi:hypothetical protein